ncbi:type I methionyl aminopeptidase [Brumimicrobium salinarum]|uniref:Methionine aminopeptidase n=1 Tax=Brumimicrobium salinarum TaxID=2058658 RepID=A0A2I0R2N0_9FLAO|nr:type I methionyl aminopeptidase [Brumimicrobium salinarum]PKR80841.1 type I methionyl aminopeptidase [Brumimicrobium salinarum]
MIKYKSREEVELLREAAQVVSRTLGKVAEAIEVGVTTLELDAIAESYIRSQNAEPGFLGLYDFPNTLCVSINDEVVHGYPRNEPIKDGDIVSIDCGAILNGYYGDHAYTFAVGNVSEEKLKLLKVTQECLEIGIAQTKVGNRLGDIGFHIQKHAEAHGYGVVRELVGHGIGKTMHEEPQVPNYGRRGRGKKIKEGLTIAIEPMINLGTKKIKYLEDNWTIATLDGMASAHFEHDVAVVDGMPEKLSTFEYVEKALAKKK